MEVISDKISVYDFSKPLFLFTPPGYGKSVLLPQYLSSTIGKVLVVVPNELHVNYFTRRNNKSTYISADNLWDTVIDKYSKTKCKLDLDYDLIIFDDYSDSNTEYEILIKILMHCNYKKIMLQTSNVYRPFTDTFDVEKLIIPFNPFHTDIRYHDMNYEFNDNQMIKDLARLITMFNDSSVEGNFVVILPKSYQVNMLHKKLTVDDKVTGKENIIFKYTHYDSLSEMNKLYSIDPDVRLIVIITDTLESLLSLPRIGIVFETGYESVVTSTPSGSVRRMVLPISHERLGKYCSRLNVTFPGICFRMFTRDRLDKVGSGVTPRNLITKTGLFWYRILQLRSKGIEFEDNKLEESFNTLKVLDICNDYREESCIFCHKCELSIRNSLVLFKVMKGMTGKGQLLITIIILSFIDTYDTQWYRLPKKRSDEIDAEFTLRLNEYRREFILKYAGNSDIDTFVNVWNAITHEKGLDTDQVTIGVSQNKFFQLIKLVKNVINFIQREYRIEIDTRDVKVELNSELIKLIANVYQDRILSLDGDNNYYIGQGDDLIKYRLDQKFTFNLFSANPPQSIVNLIDIKTRLEGGLSFIILAMSVQN